MDPPREEKQPRLGFRHLRQRLKPPTRRLCDAGQSSASQIQIAKGSLREARAGSKTACGGVAAMERAAASVVVPPDRKTHGGLL